MASAATSTCRAPDAQAELPHVVLFPFMAKSHTIPLTDLAHLLRRRKLAAVAFLTTPGNAAFVRARRAVRRRRRGRRRAPVRRPEGPWPPAGRGVHRGPSFAPAGSNSKAHSQPRRMRS
ncbi:hypothetical protein ACP70R_006759 [Stipagrostis hirtigluma subsp. patula]